MIMLYSMADRRFLGETVATDSFLTDVTDPLLKA